MELREPALLPFIEVLFNRGYVDEFLYRSFHKIAEDVAAPPRADDKRELMNIYDRYQQVVTTWAGYTEEEEDETDDEIWDDNEEWDDDEDRITVRGKNCSPSQSSLTPLILIRVSRRSQD